MEIAISERREDLAVLIISEIGKTDFSINPFKNAVKLAVGIDSYRICRHLLINCENRQDLKAVMKDLQGKCENKDILKLFVRHKQKKNRKFSRNWGYFFILFMVLLIKLACSSILSDLDSLFQTKNSLFTERIFSYFLFFATIFFLIILRIKTPGYEKINPLYELSVMFIQDLYSKYNSEFVCNYCKSKKHKFTKHCFYCKKCVIDHDHHCKWINNCVGKENFICFALFLVILFISCCFDIFAVFYFEKIEYLADFSMANESFKKKSRFFWSWSCLLINFVILMFLCPNMYKTFKRYRFMKIEKLVKPLRNISLESKKKGSLIRVLSGSDTESMLLVAPSDCNSESKSSASSFLSQFFTK